MFSIAHRKCYKKFFQLGYQKLNFRLFPVIDSEESIYQDFKFELLCKYSTKLKTVSILYTSFYGKNLV
jgi:hypothetical protein